MFRSNQPELGLLYPLVGLVFWLPGWWIEHATTPELTLIWFSPNNPLHAGKLGVAAGLIAVLLGAFLFNRIFQQYDLISRKNQIPGLCYVLAFSWSPLLIQHNYLLYALVFVLLAIQSLMQIYRQHNVLGEVFNASILIGIATIIYIPAAAFIIAIWLSLIVLRSFNAREWLMPIAGIATVAALFFGVDYVFDWHAVRTLTEQVNINVQPLDSNPYEWTKYVTAALLFGLSLVAAPRFLHALSRSTTRNRNLKLVLLCFSVIMLGIYAALFLTPGFQSNHSLLGFPLALALVYALADKRINWFVSGLFYILILSALASNYTAWLLK